MSQDFNRQYEGVDLRNVGFATLGPRISLPRLQEIMAEGFDFERALKLRQYLQSIDNGALEWKVEVDAIKAEMKKQWEAEFTRPTPSQDAA